MKLTRTASLRSVVTLLFALVVGADLNVAALVEAEAHSLNHFAASRRAVAR